MLLLKEEEEIVGIYVHRDKPLWRCSKKAATCQPKQEASGETNVAETRSWTSSLQDCEIWKQMSVV